MALPFIKVEELTFYYSGSDVPALNNINLVVNEGEFIGVTGPTGAGKSTLSLCFNGVIPHYQSGKIAGRVTFNQRPVAEIPNGELARMVGSVFQDPEAQIVSMTVEEEIAFGMENLGFTRELMLERIEASLDMVGISHLRTASTVALSGGQKQRVAIAAVLAVMPKVLVLDEPASELDPLGTDELFETLARLNKEHGITIILIEQRMDQLAPFLDRLVVLDKGSLIADGHPTEVLAKREVVTLGVRVPQVTELALLVNPKSQKVPVSFEEGVKFIDGLLNGRGGM